MVQRSGHGGSSAVLLGVLAGAVLGAAGLGVWLLAEADRRRFAVRRRTFPGPGRLAPPDEPPPGPRSERDLHDKVNALNQAIEDVRRQLEGLSTGS